MMTTGAAAHGGPVERAERRLRRTAEEDVLGHRQFGEKQQFLVHGGDARGVRVARRGETPGRAIDEDLAGVGLVQAGHDLYEGGLAGAVLAEQGMNFAGADIEGDIGQRPDSGECLRDATQLDRRSGHPQVFSHPLSRPAVGRSSGARGSGPWPGIYSTQPVSNNKQW